MRYVGISGEEDDDGNGASGKNSKPTPAKRKEAGPPVMCPKCKKKVSGVKKDDRLIPPGDVIKQLGCCAKCYKEDKNNAE